jgi:hypothetical protein
MYVYRSQLSYFSDWQALKLNVTHQLLASAHDINIVVENMDTIQKNTETLLDEVNTEKTNSILMIHYQKAGQRHSLT